jgi:hypothetical protein
MCLECPSVAEFATEQKQVSIRLRNDTEFRISYNLGHSEANCQEKTNRSQDEQQLEFAAQNADESKSKHIGVPHQHQHHEQSKESRDELQPKRNAKVFKI